MSRGRQRRQEWAERYEAVFEAIFERFALPLDPFGVPLPPDEPNPLGTLRTELEMRFSRALRHAISWEQLSADLDAYQSALFIHATLTGVFRNDLLRRRHNTRLNLGSIVGLTFQCLTRH